MAGHVVAAGLASAGFDVVPTYNRHPVEDAVQFSAVDLRRYDEFFTATEVDVVVNCIGVLVSESEQDPRGALIANAHLPRYLESRFRGSRTKVIHISTDCVFDGAAGPYSVTDRPTEVSMYGVTKALGEISNNKDITIRTSIIGPELSTRESASPGLLHWLLRQGRGSEVKGFSRCVWSGISTLELADAVVWAARTPSAGVHHVSREVGISKYDLLSLAVQVFDLDLKVTPCDEKVINKHLKPSGGSFSVTESYEGMLLRIRRQIESSPHLYTY